MSRFGNLEFDGEFAPQEAQRTNDETYWWDKARAEFERAEFEPALRYFARVLEHNPQNLPAWTGQVRSLIELGEYREAKLWAEKALERFRDAPELLAAKAVALARLGETESALAFSDASIEERGDTPYIWLARGDVLLARKEKRAEYCFDKALALAPQDWFVAWLVARIRQFYGEVVAALRIARLALEWNPVSRAAWVTAGECERACGFPDHARRSFHRALELDPQCVAAETALRELSQAGLLSRLAGKWRQLFRA